jgi:hypothetical protein
VTEETFMRHLLLPALLVCAAPALAAEVTQPLVCGLVDVFDCSRSECTEVNSEVVGVPDLVRVDPGKKTLRALDAEFDDTAEPLESVTSDAERTAVRARSGDRTLVLVIEKASGDAMMTVSDHKLTLVAFGECGKP